MVASLPELDAGVAAEVYPLPARRRADRKRVYRMTLGVTKISIESVVVRPPRSVALKVTR